MDADLCPWLGTADDKEVRHADASEVHVCHAQTRPARIKLDYQARFCLLAAHRTCTFYSEPPAPSVPEAPKAEADEVGLARRRPRWLLLALWLISLVLVAVVIYLYVPPLLGRFSPTSVPPSAVVALLPTAGDLPSAAAQQPSHLSTSVPGYAEATASPTPYPGGSIYRLAPEARAAGWVASDEGTGNHLGDSYLYSGVFGGVIYHGIIQFDLSAVAGGATIHSGVLELTGLDRLRVADGGVWEVRILETASGSEWASTTYQAAHGAAVQWTLSPALSSADLLVGQTNSFVLQPKVLRDMEQRILGGHTALSVRLDGPLAGGNNVFAWDSGYGPATRGNAPRLLLNVGPPPETPAATTTPRYLVVTSTPTPGNVLTAAVMLQTSTAVAQNTGQPGPGSVVYWTATPVIVVTSVPTPANQATADYERALATAIAMTTGTFTPTPGNMVTATPPGGTPAPPTTTPRSTQQSPTGTPVPTPQPTATSLPTPRRTATPLPTTPAGLENRILFRSDRAVSANPWVMNPDGTGVTQLSDGSAYEAATAIESLSPDGLQRTYVGQVDGMPAVFVAPAAGGKGLPLVAFQDAELESPVWAPAGSRLAFVAVSQSGTQIWLINSNGTGLRELTYEAWGAASHPTFSPDGQSLAYASVLVPGKRQIWTIRVDGSGRSSLSDGAHDDWDPVWVK